MDKNKRFELLARGIVLGLIIGLVALIVIFRLRNSQGVIELHGVMSENGGWTPGNLTAKVGEPLRLRLIADDVMHGFAIGQKSWPAIDLKPGQPVETEIVFDEPGKYTYYCTRWCGPNHWRMRGVIEVAGVNDMTPSSPGQLLYVSLGLNLDDPHPAKNLPMRQPEAAKGLTLLEGLPSQYLSLEYYQTHSPDQAWEELRADSRLVSLQDDQIWDLVAAIWSKQATPDKLQEGRRLFAANCAACHGETGAGNGVMATQLAAEGGSAATETAHSATPVMDHQETPQSSPAISGHTTTQPTDFTNPTNMLGASPALLQGKIVRGGMGTGMPYWGPIFTEEQIWSLVAFLWSFQFDFM